MKTKRLSLSLLLALGISATAFATQPDVRIAGYKPAFLPSYQIDASGNYQPQPNKFKKILLENIEFSKAAAARMNAITDVASLDDSLFTSKKPVLLGMGGVPVLDQGPWGTCVTFATTAIVDAATKSSDYISQLCGLELGQYLAQTYGEDQQPSGWDGALAPILLGRMHDYGVIAKSSEVDGCGGLTSYPSSRYSYNNGSPMDVDTFKNHSGYDATLLTTISPNELLNVQNATLSKKDGANVLKAVKAAIDKGNRVTFGILLDVNQGSYLHPITGVGVFGKFNKNSSDLDSWIMTKAITKDLAAAKRSSDFSAFGGHEMVITGYDDKAVIQDVSGNKSKGVLYLRNSWGSDVGYHGEFYMSYDYFSNFVFEAYEIAPASSSAAKHS